MIEKIRWLWIRIRKNTAEAAERALGEASDHRHSEAMVEPDKARRASLRAEADYFADEQNELRDATRNGQEEKP